MSLLSWNDFDTTHSNQPFSFPGHPSPSFTAAFSILLAQSLLPPYFSHAQEDLTFYFIGIQPSLIPLQEETTPSLPAPPVPAIFLPSHGEKSSKNGGSSASPLPLLNLHPQALHPRSLLMRISGHFHNYLPWSLGTIEQNGPLPPSRNSLCPQPAWPYTLLVFF